MRARQLFVEWSHLFARRQIGFDDMKPRPMVQGLSQHRLGNGAGKNRAEFLWHQEAHRLHQPSRNILGRTSLPTLSDQICGPEYAGGRIGQLPYGHLNLALDPHVEEYGSGIGTHR